MHREVGFLNLNDPRGLDPMVHALESNDRVVVDTRAASGDLILNFFKSLELPGLLASLGAEVTFAIPVGGELDSIDQIARVATNLGTSVRYVIVLNQVFADRLKLFNASKIRQELKTQFAGVEISMPEMPPWLVASLSLHGLTSTTALTHPEVSLLDRQRLKNWTRAFVAELREASELLSLPIAPKAGGAQ